MTLVGRGANVVRVVDVSAVGTAISETNRTRRRIIRHVLRGGGKRHLRYFSNEWFVRVNGDETSTIVYALDIAVGVISLICADVVEVSATCEKVIGVNETAAWTIAPNLCAGVESVVDKQRRDSGAHGCPVGIIFASYLAVDLRGAVVVVGSLVGVGNLPHWPGVHGIDADLK